MGLLIPSSTTVTIAAGTSAGTFNGGDISAIKSGMTLNPGSYDGESGVSRVLLSVTPAGNGIGGTFTIKGSFATAYNAAPFVVDPKGGDGAYATFLVVRIYNILMTWIGGVVLDAPSKTVRLDRGAAGSGTSGRQIFSILGRDWFGIAHRTSGGAEALRLAAYPDGTTETGGVTIKQDGSVALGIDQLPAVQQGGGAGQSATNRVKLGWDGNANLKGAVDGVDLGIVWTDYSATKLLGASGYQRLPSGLIIQWFKATITGGDVALTHPVAFPNACNAVFVSPTDSPADANLYAARTDTLTVTGFNARGRGISTGGLFSAGLVCNFLCIGR